MEEIRNKVDESGLVQLDLEQLIRPVDLAEIDLAQFLENGFLLREKSFRQAIQQFETAPFSNKQVAVFCSTDAIIPLWSWMLLGLKLRAVQAETHQGRPEEVQKRLFLQQLESLPLEVYENQRVIVKGCADRVPEEAYVRLTQRLQPLVKTLMFGEACSAVPLYKSRS